MNMLCLNAIVNQIELYVPLSFGNSFKVLKKVSVYFVDRVSK